MNNIILGTAQFGMSYGISNKFGQVSLSEIEQILDYAQSVGINTLDTAHGYGESEKNIGLFIKNKNKQKWNIITKVSSKNGSIVSQLKESIDRLNVVPTMVLAHSVEDYLDNNFCNEIFSLKDLYGINKIGVSIYTDKEILRILDSRIPDIIQLPLNIFNTNLYHKGILKKIKEKNIEIHARSIFLQGLFYLSDEQISFKHPDFLEKTKRLKTILQNENISIPELSLLWVNSLNDVDRVVIGLDNIGQLRCHIRTLEKSVSNNIFKKALSIRLNDKILNPRNW